MKLILDVTPFPDSPLTETTRKCPNLLPFIKGSEMFGSWCKTDCLYCMFPIGRYLTLSADDSFPKNPEKTLSVGCIFNNPECAGQESKHIPVREMVSAGFNIPTKRWLFLYMDKNTGNTLQTSTISGRTHGRKDHDFNMECYFDNSAVWTWYYSFPNAISAKIQMQSYP